MNIILLRHHLKEALMILERAVHEHAQLPVLRNILIEANENKIKLSATNLEIGIVYSLSGKIIEPGSVSIPVSTCHGFISLLQGDRLTLESQKYDLRIQSENTEAVFRGINPEEFPIIPKVKNINEYIQLQGGVLSETIDRVLSAAQQSEVRPELNNMFFSFSLDNITCAATDSFRLAERVVMKSFYESHNTQPHTLLIPLKTITTLQKTLKTDDEVRIYRDDNQILFQTKNWELISRLSEGSFPDYHAILPKQFPTEIIIDRTECIQALKLTGIFGSRTSEIILRCDHKGKTISFAATDQALGESTNTLPARIKGDVSELRFNPRYVIDGMRGVVGKEVVFSVSEGEDKVLLKSPQDPSFFYLLVPNKA